MKNTRVCGNCGNLLREDTSGMFPAYYCKLPEKPSRNEETGECDGWIQKEATA